MTTNREWLNKLANDDPAALNAWFESSCDEVAEKVRSIDGLKAMNPPHFFANEIGEWEPDTREKLEADVREWWYPSHRLPSVHSKENVDRVLGWLDRQAAITAEEAADAWADYSDSVQNEIAELQAKVDELDEIASTKRVTFGERIKFVNRIEELEAENERLKERREIELLIKPVVLDAEVIDGVKQPKSLVTVNENGEVVS